MGKYCYIVTANKRYTPEVVAMFNSLDFVGNTHDVFFIEHDFDQDVLDQLDKLSYKVTVHHINEEEIQDSHGLSEILCRKRYWYAATIGANYDAICVLDADLVWVRNPELFFTVAEKTGFILGPHKEQNKVYDDPHHKFNNEWILPEVYYNNKDLCNCPLFIDANVWKEALKESWTWFKEGFPENNMKCPDMDCMNIAFIKYGGANKIIKLSNHQWLGTNETLLKPYTRACSDRENLIKTENGQDIFCYHGQFYKSEWRACQLDNRHRCANGYLKTTECPDNMAQGSMNLLYEYFKKMLDYKIVIEKKNWNHPEKEYIP
ncbi:MAG TPA: hypothetical protein VMW91_05875 [Desulfosporosinus sp.]|nr:hypothetical protein [Desulfosporosinus sp.]